MSLESSNPDNAFPVGGDTKKHVARLRARTDYVNMPVKSRSVNALFRQYVEKSREDNDNRSWIPTLNRNEIYEWAKVDNWDGYAKSLELESIESQRKRTEDARNRAYSEIALLGAEAVSRLQRVVSSGDDKLAMQASLEILNRIGVVPLVGRAAERPGKTNTAAEDPDPNWSDEQLSKWMTDRRRN